MQLRNKFLFSIIIPVYNAQLHLKTCIDSLLGQDIDTDHYEIICVNDGSSDESLAILREYECANSNIRVIDKANGGVSSARNSGLDAAAGEYVWFVDADDWVVRNCLGHIAAEIEEKNPSVILVPLDYIKAQWRINECQEKKLNEDVHCDLLDLAKLNYTGIGTAILKRELLDHRFINNMAYGEDILFVRDVFDRVRMEDESGEKTHIAIQYTGDIFYYYRIHDDSAMHQSWTKNRKKYMDALLQMAQIDKTRMQDNEKPKWYTDQYAALFLDRMYNYMMNWLPGACDNLTTHLTWLNKMGLYPCPKPPKKIRHVWMAGKSIAEKVKRLYIYIAFRHRWLYAVYYKQMTKKYQKAADSTKT